LCKSANRKEKKAQGRKYGQMIAHEVLQNQG